MSIHTAARASSGCCNQGDRQGPLSDTDGTRGDCKHIATKVMNGLSVLRDSVGGNAVDLRVDVVWVRESWLRCSLVARAVSLRKGHLCQEEGQQVLKGAEVPGVLVRYLDLGYRYAGVCIVTVH